MSSLETFPFQLVERLAPRLCDLPHPASLFEETMAFLERTLGAKGGVLLTPSVGGGFSVMGTFGEGLAPLKGHLWEPPEEALRCLHQRSIAVLSIPQQDPLLGHPWMDRGLFFLAPLYASGSLRGALGTFYASPPWREEDLRRAMAWVATLVGPPLALSSFWEELSLDEILERKVDLALSRMAEGEQQGVLPEVLAVVERRLIALALRKVGGVQVRAARLLGLSRNTLRKKIEEYGIEP